LDKKFRIVRTTENRGIKIIEDSVISGVFYNKTRGGIGVFYSSYNSVPYISQKNYKLEEYKTYSGFRNYYDCSESSVTTTWDDSTSFTCKNDYGSTVSTKSPIYTYIYKPLLNRYNNIKSYLEQYIDKEYKWCITTNKSSTTSNITFKCNVEKNMESEFGILNLFEYKNIQYMVSSAQYIYGKNLGAHCSKNSEVAFTQVSGAQDFATTWAIDPGYENGDYCYEKNRTY